MAEGAATKEIMSANSSIMGRLLPYFLAIVPSIPSARTASMMKTKAYHSFEKRRHMDVVPNMALSNEKESAFDNLARIVFSNMKMPREGVEPSTLRSSAVRSPN